MPFGFGIGMPSVVLVSEYWVMAQVMGRKQAGQWSDLVEAWAASAAGPPPSSPGSKPHSLGSGPGEP